MRVVVASYGTEGDARPFAALCRGLIDAGHEALLLADAGTLGAAKALGVPTAALAGDIRAALSRQTGAAAIGKGGGFNATARALAEIANANARDWMRVLVEAAEGSDVVLAAGLSAFAAFSAAERTGATPIGAGMIPITPTSAFPSPFLPQNLLPRWLNAASHRFVNAMLWRAFRKETNAARAEFGLPARKAVWTGLPMLYGVSPHLLPPPADWPANVRLSGQWLAKSPEWTPPPALADYLAAGEPPIYAGFGSMAGFDAARLIEALGEATAGRRVLFNPGWSGAESAQLPPHFFAIADAPHDWLLPRTAAVVHHGGAGVSHSAARAGVPSVVVPFAGDQFFWAGRLRAAGVAAEAVDARRPSAQAFARSLEFAASASARARELGEAMRAEDGVAMGVALIERMSVKS